jgi:hypothetical protein
MCGISAIRTDLRVFVADRAVPHVVEGYLAAGVLVDYNKVLVPDPPTTLQGDDVEPEVWITPFPPARDQAVEIAAAPKLRVVGVRDGGPTAMLLELAHPSRYACQLGPIEPGELDRVLTETGGDLWSALERAQVVPTDIRQVSEETLRTTAEVAREQRRPRRDGHVVESYADLLSGICDFCCCCRPQSAS